MALHESEESLDSNARKECTESEDFEGEIGSAVQNNINMLGLIASFGGFLFGYNVIFCLYEYIRS